MTTVKELVKQVQRSIDEITTLQAQISEAYYGLSNPNKHTYVQSEIQKLKDEETSYNTQFEEEESKLQAMGGKTRKQTLQEFVLFFFYLAFGLFIVSVVVYVSVKEQNTKKTIQVAFTLLFILFITTGILIRYA
jgi:hypothetical protein